MRNAGKYSPALFTPEPGRPAEWEILLRLAAIVAGQKAAEVDVGVLDDFYFSGIVGVLAQKPGSPIFGRDPSAIVAATPGCGPERLLDFAIRIGPWGEGYGANPDGLTLEALRALPHGIDQGPLTPRLPGLLTTPSGKIELAPDYVPADVPRLRERLARRDAGLVLVSRRHLRSNNSWLHNVEKLVAGRERCTLLIHPDDAARLGIVAGGRASVRSSAGVLEAPVQISDEMMPGVVCLPHGWGHDRRGVRLAVAARHAGVNNNLLAPIDFVDVPSGNAAVNGIPVEVSAC
ncbi:MAG: molybdopterin dinucleotide binding domain-containing protein [Thermodesulfobacteriota bacterium]